MSNTKKSLLNENTIRRFMKLAEIDTLSDGFVTGLVKEEVEEVNERAEEFEVAPDDGPADGPSGMGDVEDAVDDVEDLDMAPEEAPESDRLAAAVSDLMAVIADMTGVDIDVAGGEEEMALGDEEELDVDVEDEVEMMGEDAARARHQRDPRRPSGDKGEQWDVDQPTDLHDWPGATHSRRGKEKDQRHAAQQESLQRAAAYRHALTTRHWPTSTGKSQGRSCRSAF
jgi:hypothetical protein